MVGSKASGRGGGKGGGRARLGRESLASPAIDLDWRGLIGHGDSLERWRALAGTDRLPAVLLLTGRAGLGKRRLLAALAALDQCESEGLERPCGTCGSCQDVMRGRHPEVLWLEVPAGERFGIAAAASAQEHLELKPSPPSRRRTVVLVDADQLSDVAANRLLKTLEEPPASARLLLSTSRPGALLPTVRSRLVPWRVRPPAAAELRPWLLAELAAAGQPPPAPELVDEWLRLSGLAPALLRQWAGLAVDPTGGQLDLSPLWAASSPTEVMQAVEVLARQSGVPLGGLLNQIERELNRAYRGQKISTTDASPPVNDPFVARRRRDLLRRARRLVIKGAVPLSPTLLLESLAMGPILERSQPARMT